MIEEYRCFGKSVWRGIRARRHANRTFGALRQHSASHSEPRVEDAGEARTPRHVAVHDVAVRDAITCSRDQVAQPRGKCFGNPSPVVSFMTGY